jgi:hypothetical protein
MREAWVVGKVRVSWVDIVVGVGLVYELRLVMSEMRVRLLDEPLPRLGLVACATKPSGMANYAAWMLCPVTNDLEAKCDSVPGRRGCEAVGGQIFCAVLGSAGVPVF